MKQSMLFGKTQKNAKEFSSINATFLIKGGFIDQTMAGGYTYLTLGLRVLEKIERIIREEMNKISSEVLMPSIVPMKLWETTGRLGKVDVLMKTTPANAAAKEKNDTEYILNSTHEEVVTPLAQKYYLSYKDFPVSVYQIQTKFRNEPRAKSGLMRCREFRMKDMYSFHTTEDDLKAYYDIAKQAYWAVYERLGIKQDTYIALASGGDFTEDYSHEFQTRCDTGEDILFHVSSKDITYNREVAPSKAPELVGPGNVSEEMKEKAEHTAPTVGVEALAKEIGITVEQTTKTMMYETETGQVVAVAVRGGYEIDTEKVKKILGCKKLELASAAALEKAGTVAGFVGAMGLPDHVRVLFDESTKNRRNFEMGGNKKDLHVYNLNWGRDLEEPEQFYDIKVAKEGDLYPETGEMYEVFKAAEVGNIFPLYTKFTKDFGYTFIGEDNQAKEIYMGCYGIGSSRIMGVIAEKYNDANGLIWPEQIAPFTVHLIGLNLDDEHVQAKIQQLYEQLETAGIDVLFDDRNARPGEKFADADLIGIPYRVVISKKTGDQVEVKKRNETTTEMMSVSDLMKLLAR